MVFVRDFKKEFYDVVQNQRVLVLVAFDVDALCACKILQYLFQCDHVLYTIVPVTGKAELENACFVHAEGVQYVVMLNCGGTIDIIEMLQPEQNMVFFICDSHRPVHIKNVYNQVQVQLLMKEEEFDNVPAYNDVFNDDDNESENESGSESDEDSERSKKRRRFDEAALERRRQRRLFEENSRRLLLEYMEFSSYGTSAALLMHDMAWKMSKDTNDLLWLAIVGATEQYLNEKVQRDTYIESISRLQPHVSRLNHRFEDAESAVSVDCLRITFSEELQLPLYRHWSLIDSLCHSSYTACRFRVWSLKGKKRLHEFLADMGLPLVQCRQKYSAMDISLKDSIKEMIVKHAEKYGISEQDLFLPSFHAQYGYRSKYCAGDVIHVCEAYLESIEQGHTASDKFLNALDILNRSKTDSMVKGLEMSKTRLKAIAVQVQSFLDMNQIISAGPFLYSFVQEGTPDAKFFSHPLCLCQLAKFALEAHCVTNKNKKAKTLPLVLGAHLDAERGTMLVIAVAPVSDKSRKNCFGQAFEQAAVSTKSRVLHDSFDSHVMELKLEDRSKFFDALVSLLTD